MTVEEPAELDPEFAAELERLMPFMIDAAISVYEKLMEDAPKVTHRPAQVEGVDIALRTASVLCDGDTSPITVQVKTELPYNGARVFVEFWPDGSVFVSGFISPCGIPVGASLDFHGAITRHAGAAASDAEPGEPPPGFELEAGQAVSRSVRAALFSVVGTVHGAGDGATTFNVPDTRGRVGVGVDNMGGSDAGRLSAANTLGGSGGAETHTISTSEMPPHSHGLGSHTHGSGSYSTNSTGSHSHNLSSSGYFQGGSGFSYDTAGAGGFALGGGTTDSQGSHSHSLSGTSGPASGSTGSTGSGSAVNHMPPYFLVNKIIKC